MEGIMGQVDALTAFPGLEEQLRMSLNPINPDPEFVHRLRTRLVSRPNITVEQRPGVPVFIIIACGLFSGALLVWLLRRLS
jgi:hypothetical protein